MTNRIFPHSTYDQLVRETWDEVISLGIKKGGEYAGDDDRLANFRRNAARAETSMEFVWRIYASKHWDAIMQYELDLRKGVVRDRLETLEGRADDLIVYLLLFKAMLQERASVTLEEAQAINAAEAALAKKGSRFTMPPLSEEPDKLTDYNQI